MGAAVVDGLIVDWVLLVTATGVTPPLAASLLVASANPCWGTPSPTKGPSAVTLAAPRVRWCGRVRFRLGSWPLMILRNAVTVPRQMLVAQELQGVVLKPISYSLC
jgi:hypothetical protein